MSRSLRAKAKNRRESGSFIAVPHTVLNHPNYFRLGSNALRLLWDIAAQVRYAKGRGSTNNGDLSAAWTVMKPRGWKSKDTLEKARAELCHYGWLDVTQQGRPPRIPTLYALTWLPVDEIQRKPWIAPTRAPSNRWKQDHPAFVFTRKKPCPDERATTTPHSRSMRHAKGSTAPPIGSASDHRSYPINPLIGALYRSTTQCRATNGPNRSDMNSDFRFCQVVCGF